MVAGVALLTLAASSASAAPILVTGNATGTLATASGELTLVDGTLTFTLENTSPFDARITGVGFDIGAGNLDGFDGDDVGTFTFDDGDLGNVPQFNSAVLDFGFLTGNNFNGGKPNDGIAPGDELEFVVLGDFGVLTAEQLAGLIFVRFQRVGEDEEGSDVAVAEEEGEEEGGQEEEGGTVPEPASLVLFAAGIAAGAARLRQTRR